jgi:hypothetical protein
LDVQPRSLAVQEHNRTEQERRDRSDDVRVGYRVLHADDSNRNDGVGQAWSLSQHMPDLEEVFVLHFGHRDLLRRLRGDVLLKARIAAERLPQSMQLELAVTAEDRRTGPRAGLRQVVEGQILLTYLRGDDGEVDLHRFALERVLLYGHQLHRTFAFLEGEPLLLLPRSAAASSRRCR